MAIAFLMLATGLSTAISTWLLLRFLQTEFLRYRTIFKHDTEVGLADFFLFLDASRLWGAHLSWAIACAGLALLISGQLFMAVVIGILVLVAPRWALAWARGRRHQKIDEQLPDFLMALAGALRAGAGLQTGLRMVAAHVRRPLSQELGLMLQQQRMGMSFQEGLDALHTRVGTESVGLVVAAIKVAGHTGGSLAETLERIAQTLRTRLHLLRKVRALTSQGRMQAWIMAGLPIMLIVALYSLDPHTMQKLWTTPLGWGVLVLLAVLDCVGLFLVRRIVNIEV